jgi:hypothetical protein
VSIYRRRLPATGARDYKFYVWDGDIHGLAEWLKRVHGGTVTVKSSPVAEDGEILVWNSNTVFRTAADNKTRAKVWTATSERRWESIDVGEALWTKDHSEYRGFLHFSADTLAKDYILVPEDDPVLEPEE